MRTALTLCLLISLGCAAAPAPTRPQTVSFPVGRETGGGFFAQPTEGAGPRPAVILVHEDMGLDAGMRARAERLADAGFAVLAVDLFRGKVLDNIEDAHIVERGLPEGRAVADIKAAADWLAKQPGIDGRRLGIVGWDMGAGYALDAAIADPRLSTCVVCYGRLTTDAKLLAPLRASVLGVFGGADEGISPTTIAQFLMAMEKAGKPVAGLHLYAGAPHGFMTPGKDGAESPAAADAWRRITEYLGAMKTEGGDRP